MRRGVLVLAVLGCDTVAIDPSVSGIFPCEATPDCPPTQTCVIGTCYREEPPRVVVISPEAEVAFPVGADDRVPVVVKLGGEHLELVEPRDDPDDEFGKGHIAVLVDGVEQASVRAGDLADGVTMQVLVDAAPGAHRIQAIPRNSAGVPYDNPGAEGRRLFWLDDGEPHVAFFEPFPGDVFPLESTEIEIGIATLNFTLDRPMAGIEVTSEVRSGHVHVHYDAVFPECVADPVCDGSQIGMVTAGAPSSSAEDRLRLPGAIEGQATLTAVLRKANHFVFLSPPWTDDPVFEDIAIGRADTATDRTGL